MLPAMPKRRILDARLQRAALRWRGDRNVRTRNSGAGGGRRVLVVRCADRRAVQADVRLDRCAVRRAVRIVLRRSGRAAGGADRVARSAAADAAGAVHRGAGAVDRERFAPDSMRGKATGMPLTDGVGLVASCMSVDVIPERQAWTYAVEIFLICSIRCRQLFQSRSMRKTCVTNSGTAMNCPRKS